MMEPVVSEVLIPERQIASLVSLLRVCGVDECRLCLEPLQPAVFLRRGEPHDLEQCHAVLPFLCPEINQHLHVLTLMLALQGRRRTAEGEVHALGSC